MENQMNFYLDFTDYTSYIAARTQWRVDYKNLSATKRALKVQLKKVQQDFQKVWSNEDEIYALYYFHPTRTAAREASVEEFYLRSSMRKVHFKINEMMMTRMEMRKRAHRMFSGQF
jgi:hypothetical protein